MPQAALPQQTPSTQLPDAHSFETEQALPSRVRQVLEASQIRSPRQVSSAAFSTGEQVPILPASAQLSQEPSQAASQQTPSTQKPLAHCAPIVQFVFAGGGTTPPSRLAGASPASAIVPPSGWGTDASEPVRPPPSAPVTPPSLSVAPPAGPHAASEPTPISRPAMATQVSRFALQVRRPNDVAVMFMGSLAVGIAGAFSNGWASRKPAGRPPSGHPNPSPCHRGVTASRSRLVRWDDRVGRVHAAIAFSAVLDEDRAPMALPRSSFRVAALLAIALAAATSSLLATTATAVAATDAEDQDLKARKLFAGGDYRQALDIYVNLYAETLHPTYLRNIARCQQNLGEADKAIASFREYLRKAKDLSAAQRQEIEGYIAEMEDLKRRQAGAGSGARAPSRAEPADSVAAPPAAANLAAPPPATPEPAPTVLLTSPAPAAERDEGSPFYTRAWFWVALGAVAAGTVAAVVLLGGDDGKKPLATLDLTRKP